MHEDTKKKERRKMPKKNKHKTDVSGEKDAKRRRKMTGRPGQTRPLT